MKTLHLFFIVNFFPPCLYHQSERLCGPFCHNREWGIWAYQKHHLHPKLWAPRGRRHSGWGAPVQHGRSHGPCTSLLQSQHGCQTGKHPCTCIVLDLHRTCWHYTWFVWVFIYSFVFIILCLDSESPDRW